jgi:FkbM family methyltransferase
MHSQADQSVQRKAGIGRRLLRATLASSQWLLPTKPTLRQVKVGDLQVLCWINDHIGRRLLLARSYEPNDIAALKQIVRPGDTIADIGGNIGYLALHFAKFSGKTGRVFAFEPMAHLHPVVALNANLNGFSNITVHPVVVAETSDKRAGAHIPDEAGGAPMAYFTLSDAADGVATIRLDDFASRAGIGKFDIIKIDVEGGEVSVLKGSTGILQDPKRRPRVLMIEIVDAQLRRFDHRLKDIYDMLVPLGYKASIYRDGRFEAVTHPESADCWNVFFSCEPLSAANIVA